MQILSKKVFTSKWPQLSSGWHSQCLGKDDFENKKLKIPKNKLLKP
jgi:hypothetical protein